MRRVHFTISGCALYTALVLVSTYLYNKFPFQANASLGPAFGSPRDAGGFSYALALAVGAGGLLCMLNGALVLCLCQQKQKLAIHHGPPSPSRPVGASRGSPPTDADSMQYLTSSDGVGNGESTPLHRPIAHHHPPPNTIPNYNSPSLICNEGHSPVMR